MIDIRTYGAIPDGVTDCTAAINAALIDGDIIIQNGIFALSQSIKIPSNRTVYGKTAKLKMKNGTYDNIFRNSDFVNGNTGIKIIGQGNFVLDGNAANNNDNYATYGKAASAGAYHYLTIAFARVINFEVSGFSVSDYPHWFMYMQECTFGKVHDIFLNFKTLTVNQDGIDVGGGCNNIELYNIKGCTHDDMFCINTHPGADLLIIPNVSDTHDINYHDVYSYTTGQGSIFSLCGYGGRKIHDIQFNNAKMRLGRDLFHSYGLAITGTKDDQYNISMNNVVSEAAITDGYVFGVRDNCRDVTVINHVNNTGKPLFFKADGITAERFSINGVVQ